MDEDCYRAVWLRRLWRDVPSIRRKLRWHCSGRIANAGGHRVIDIGVIGVDLDGRGAGVDGDVGR